MPTKKTATPVPAEKPLQAIVKKMPPASKAPRVHHAAPPPPAASKPKPKKTTTLVTKKVAFEKEAAKEPTPSPQQQQQQREEEVEPEPEPEETATKKTTTTKHTPSTGEHPVPAAARTTTTVKKRFVKRAVLAKRAILSEQKSARPAIRVANMNRLIRYLIEDYRNTDSVCKLSEMAREAIQRNVEHFLIGVLKQAKQESNFWGRETTMGKDILQVIRLNKALPPRFRVELVGPDHVLPPQKNALESELTREQDQLSNPVSF